MADELTITDWAYLAGIKESREIIHKEFREMKNSIYAIGRDCVE